ncbi:hypothetical protein [Campylobacter mucosalis]|uniref:hypothetical protein n=1 Tax=Campylobacter mucosalis TaxID=202 RepID=UPI00146FFDBE|nr:hypothetical protein [Campylobacter mucosalis]
MRKIVICLALASLLLGAENFIGSNTEILDKVGGKPLATLLVGAKVEILKDDKEYVLAQYQGYLPEGSDISYARLGVLEADLKTTNLKALKQVEKVKDDYDNEWLKVSIKGFVKKDSLKSLATLQTEGEELFKTRCGGCHALHHYDEYNANVWPSVVESMRANSALDDTEFATLVRFLQSKAPTE